MNAIAEITTWQPIETAPKDGTHVLVFDRGRVRVSSYDVSESYQNGKLRHRSEGWSAPWMEISILGKSEPSHWMPIPAAPVEVEGTVQ